MCPAFNQMPVPPATRTRVSPIGAHGAQQKAGPSVSTGIAACWPRSRTLGGGPTPSSWDLAITITAGERAAYAPELAPLPGEELLHPEATWGPSATALQRNRTNTLPTNMVIHSKGLARCGGWHV